MDEKDITHTVKSGRKKLSTTDREKVRTLLLEGKTSKRQIARIMNVASSVIWRFDKRLRETGTIEDRPQTGRPRIDHSPSNDWIEIEGERRFECAHCHKTFVHHARLREHVRTHTGERPYKCDKCFQAFTASSVLKRHMVRHSDERQFMCDFCGKTFNNCQSLRLHIRIHTGEKPYECRYCDRRCTTAGNLNAHMRVHKDIATNIKEWQSQMVFTDVLDESENEMKNFEDDESERDDGGSSCGNEKAVSRLCSDERAGEGTSRLCSDERAGEGTSRLCRDEIAGEGTSRLCRDEIAGEGTSRLCRDEIAGEGTSVLCSDERAGEGTSRLCSDERADEGTSRLCRDEKAGEGTSRLCKHETYERTDEGSLYGNKRVEEKSFCGNEGSEDKLCEKERDKEERSCGKEIGREMSRTDSCSSCTDDVCRASDMQPDQIDIKEEPYDKDFQ